MNSQQPIKPLKYGWNWSKIKTIEKTADGKTKYINYEITGIYHPYPPPKTLPQKIRAFARNRKFTAIATVATAAYILKKMLKK